MTDEQVEKIIKSNMMLQMNLAGIRADFEEALQRTWVGLTEEEIEAIEVLRAPPVHPDFVDCDDWVEFARAIEAKLKEKNGYA